MTLLAIVTPQTVAAQSQPLIGSHPAISTTTMTSRADATQPLNIHISFAPRNPAALSKLLTDLQNPASPNYHKWLSPKEFDTRFGRSAKEIDAVRQWLSAQGMRVIASSSRGIATTATVAQAESTFATSIAASSDAAVFANMGDPKIPARFAGVIGSIEGLDNTRHSLAMALRPPHQNATSATVPPAQPFAIQRSGSQLHKAPAASMMLAAFAEYSGGSGLAFGPADLWTFYDENSLLEAGTDGGGDCIALVEDTDYLSSAVTLFNTTFSLPAATITRVLASGTNPGINGDEIEALLDIEWAHAVAPGAPIYVYIGNGATSLEDAMRRAVTDNKCSAISISYGYCGGSQSFYTSTLDSIFAQAAAQGQSIFVSSGDQGAAGIVLNTGHTMCVVGSSRSVSEMSANPNVIAVGGSKFTPTYDASHNDVGSTVETVWNDSTGATGGGASTLFSKPSWQVSRTPADNKRDVPDISLGSSPISPGFYWGDDNGGIPAMDCCVGGTSIAAPMWAGLSTLLAQGTGARLGNMNPRIYALGALHDTSVSGLRDVLSGNNNFNAVAGFPAASGYDQSTGWGTVDMSAFAAAYPVASPTPSPTPTSTPSPTPTPTPTPSPTPTVTPTPTPSPRPTPTPIPIDGPATFTPKTILYSARYAGTMSAPKIVAIVNPPRNKAPLVIGSFGLTGSNFTIDSATTTCANGLSVAIGSRCRIGVRFAPGVTGRLIDILTVADNSNNSPHQVSLRGKAK